MISSKRFVKKKGEEGKKICRYSGFELEMFAYSAAVFTTTLPQLLDK